MKSFVFLSVLFFLLLNISCTSDGLKEDLSDIPDWDYANVVDDETSGGKDDKNTDETTDNTIIEQPDENTNQTDQEETADDGEPVKGCGNEKVEYEERCDSTVPLTCSSLNPNMSGVTYCMNNCQGYDMQSCGRSDKSWGLLNLRFLSNFILDEAKIGDFSYFTKGALPYSAFNGIYGDTITIFPSFGQTNTSFAVTTNYQGTFTTKRQLYIKQNAVDGGGIGYPRHELEFSPGTISKGSEYRINAVTVFDLIDNLLKLVRYRLIEKKNGIECIMGIGYSGTVYINNIVPDNADLFDGGIIEVVANNVDFFHPSEFPGLNEENPEVPAEILKYPVCEK